jgi:hypothetical protein
MRRESRTIKRGYRVLAELQTAFDQPDQVAIVGDG